MINPDNPEELELFEGLDNDARATFVTRLQDQFTIQVALRLYAEGRTNEAAGFVPAPIPPEADDRCGVELTQHAHADWRFLTEAIGRGYAEELAAGLRILRSGSPPRGSLVELWPNGFLMRQAKLRWVYRHDPTRNMTLVYAVCRRTHNPLKKIWRYFSQKKAADLIERSQIYLSRLDTLAERDGGDRYEGTPTIPGVAGFTAALIASLGQAHPDFLRRYDHCRRATFVCCWHKAEHEALQMWLGYCREAPEHGAQSVPGGFALQTTERRLQHQLLKFNDLPRTPGQLYFLRDIDYVDHRTFEPPARFCEEVFLKANWFRDEKELRLGIQRIDCAAAGSVDQIEGKLSALPRFVRLGVDLRAITEAIVINPAASTADRADLIRTITERYPSPGLPIQSSALEVAPVTATPG
jgi:hypothetical protein